METKLKDIAILYGVPAVVGIAGYMAGHALANNFKKNKIAFGITGFIVLAGASFLAMPYMYKPMVEKPVEKPIVTIQETQLPATQTARMVGVQSIVYQVVFTASASTAALAKTAALNAYYAWRTANPTYKSNAENSVWKYDTNSGGGTVARLTIKFTK